MTDRYVLLFLQKTEHIMTLGIDLGGTNLCMGIIDNGTVTCQKTVKSFSPESSLEETLEYLSDQISEFITSDIEKIGIGVPSVVDTKKGIVYDTANIPSWKEVHLQEYLQERFHIPVSVNNDANCYAMGVYGMYPEDSKPEILVTVTLGTGMGTGIVHNGKLFSGCHCGAGELGSLPYRDSILENYCSKQFFASYGTDTKEACIRAEAGDRQAIWMFEEFGRNLGYAICAILYAYDPSHIVLGGGIANAAELFLPEARAYISRMFPYMKSLDRLTIDIFTNENIPILGASLI